jgi:hypothetical protein
MPLMRTQLTKTVKLLDVELTVTGFYYPAYLGTMEQPPEPASFDITKVEYNGDELMELLDVVESLKGKFYEKLEEEVLSVIEQ